MTKHPITPPPELVQQWEEDWHHSKVKHIELEPYIAAQAAQWGANQELEACCEWLKSEGHEYEHEALFAARRKPSSLKEQALMALEDGDTGPGALLTATEVCIIRRALEQIDD